MKLPDPAASSPMAVWVKLFCSQPGAPGDEGSLPHGWYQPGSWLVRTRDAAAGQQGSAPRAGLCRAGMMLSTGLNALCLRGAPRQGDGAALPQPPVRQLELGRGSLSKTPAGAGKRTQPPDPSAAPSPQSCSLFQQLLPTQRHRYFVSPPKDISHILQRLSPGAL